MTEENHYVTQALKANKESVEKRVERTEKNKKYFSLAGRKS